MLARLATRTQEVSAPETAPRLDDSPAPAPKRRETVNEALAWLATAPNADGGWGTEKGVASDASSTSLALLAYFGAGETHQAGPYKLHVKAGIKRLVAMQRDDGTIGDMASDHVLATTALVEAYGMTQSKPWLAPATKAVARLVAWTRAPEAESWDPFVATWAAMALKSAGMAGVDVDAAASEATRARLRADAAASIDPPTDAMRAAGATIGIAFADSSLTFPSTDEQRDALRRASEPLRALLASDPSRVRDDPMLTYLGSTALWYLDGGTCRAWTRDVVLPALAEQRPDGSFTAAPGTVRATAFRTLCANFWFRNRAMRDRCW